MTTRRPAACRSRSPSWGPFWAMLAAVWALVLLGGAPSQPRDGLCGTAPHPAHHQDCMACCPCTVSGPALAILAPPPALPRPRGAALGAAAHPTPAEATPRPAWPPRARGPPGAA